MKLVSIKRTALRWIPTTTVGIAPLAAPAIFHGIPWSGALATGAAGMLLGAAITIMRVLVLEVLSHIRLMQQLRDEHSRAVLRELHQHDEVARILHKVNDAAPLNVDVAAVVKGIRKPPSERSIPIERPLPAAAPKTAKPSTARKRARKTRTSEEKENGSATTTGNEHPDG